METLKADIKMGKQPKENAESIPLYKSVNGIHCECNNGMQLSEPYAVNILNDIPILIYN